MPWLYHRRVLARGCRMSKLRRVLRKTASDTARTTAWVWFGVAIVLLPWFAVRAIGTGATTRTPLEQARAQIRLERGRVVYWRQIARRNPGALNPATNRLLARHMAALAPYSWTGREATYYPCPVALQS